jgi:hypothetical protein
MSLLFNFQAMWQEASHLTFLSLSVLISTVELMITISQGGEDYMTLGVFSASPI